MFRSIYWYLGFLFDLIITYPKLRKVEKMYANGEIDKARKVANYEAGQFAYRNLKRAKATVTVVGEENIPNGACLFVGNHQSNFDVAVLLHHLKKDKGFIVKKELEKAWLLTRWMRLIECIFIDRSSVKKSIKAINEAVELLKNGYSLVIFPEGTRSKSSIMGEFKSGSLKMATKAKVPVVPITIDGTFRVMEANNNKIKPGHITITIHPAIETKDMTKEEEATLAENVEQIIKSKL